MATVQALGAFSPTSISGCQLWLDAADSSILSLSGANVLQWNDKSGNGRNAVFSLSNYATRTSINSGLFFSNSYYTTTYTADPTNESLFIAFRSQSSSNRIMLSSPNPNGRFVGIPDTGITPSYSVGFGKDSITWGSTVPITSNVNTITTVQFSSGSFSRISANGGAFSNYSALSFTSGSNTNIGGALSGGSLIIPYTGVIYEIIAYNSVLSSNNSQSVEGYLAWKWGLQGSLPTTHPFYYAPPNTQNLAYPVGLRIPTPLQSLQVSQSPFVFFNPTTITGCQVWLDAADPNTFTLSGTNVTTWRDKSGNGANATGSGTAVYTTNVVNRLPAVYFNGSNSYLGGSITNAGTQASFFCVFQMNTGITQYSRLASFGILGSVDYNSTTAYNVSYDTDGSTISYQRTTSAGLTLPSLNTFQLVSVVFDGTNAVIYMNGGATSNTGASSGSFNIANYRFGAAVNNTGPSQLLLGYIAEGIAYSNATSTSQRQQVEGYLAWKWGLNSSLPGNHLYKNGPPGLAMPVLATRVFQQGSFRPTQISGIQLWLDGNDPNGNGLVPTSGASVGTWVDKSGAGNNATSGTAPTFLSSAINNLGVLSFNGSTQFLNSTDLYSNRSFSIFLIIRRQAANNSGSNGMIGGTAQATNQNMIILFSSGTTLRFAFYGNDLDYSSFPAYTGNTATEPSFLIEFTYTPGSRTIFVNGNQVAFDGNTSNLTSSIGMRIGSWLSTPGSTNFNGFIGEIIVLNGTPITTSRQSIEGYLAWKWGLVGNLPNNHPFKRFPPPPN